MSDAIMSCWRNYILTTLDFALNFIIAFAWFSSVKFLIAMQSHTTGKRYTLKDIPEIDSLEYNLICVALPGRMGPHSNNWFGSCKDRWYKGIGAEGEIKSYRQRGSKLHTFDTTSLILWTLTRHRHYLEEKNYRQNLFLASLVLSSFGVLYREYVFHNIV